MSTTEERPAPIRASDADREVAVAHLHRALGEGRLDLAETDERVAAAYAARYHHELPELVADLPSEGGRAGAPTWSDVWSSIVWRTLVLATGDPTAGRPTAAQCRRAALLAAVLVVWVLLCALGGAAAVGS